MATVSDNKKWISNGNEASVGFKDHTANTIKEAVKGMEAILYSYGRGTLNIWLRMQVRDLMGGSPDEVEFR